jgi:hypothetical protein
MAPKEGVAMSKGAIEVRVHAHGSLRDGAASADASVEARCDLCGAVTDAVASVAPAGGAAPFACKTCLRERLETITVGLFMFRAPGEKGLPWGKISG